MLLATLSALCWGASASSGAEPLSGHDDHVGPRAPQVRNVAIVVWDGVELLDFAGPAEVFAATRFADGESAFHTYIVAPTKETIVSQGFVRVEPQYSVHDCPRPDLIVLPGGGTSAARGVLPWLREVQPECEVVVSVCTGAFLLAEAGLLDGHEATTWDGALSLLQERYPEVRVRGDRRFVDLGAVMTCAGVSAGIDGALHLVARLLGDPTAWATARYMEYRWQPELDAVEPGDDAELPSSQPPRPEVPSPETPQQEPASQERFADPEDEGWVCPPCSVHCHGQRYPGPGHCNVCGMQLVPRGSVPTAVVLLYEGVDLHEVAATLGVLSDSNGFLVHTVADTSDEIAVLESLHVRPQHDFESCPVPDLFVVPGGYGVASVASDDLVLDFVRESAARAETTLATGAGSVLAASAGIGGDGVRWAVPVQIARVFEQRGLEVELEDDPSIDHHVTGAVWSARDANAATRAALEAVHSFCGQAKATRTAARLGVEWMPR